MENNKAYQISNLIALRSNLVTIILTLTAGIIGLTFTNVVFTIKAILCIIGIYFDILFIINVISINQKLFNLTKDDKNE